MTAPEDLSGSLDLSRKASVIRAEGDALAAAARDHLDVPVPSCPGWTIDDLVRHIFQVQRSWYRIVDERLMEPDWVEGSFPADDELVDAFRSGAHRLADLVATTDPLSPCWTWGPVQNASFVQRFQVQEAALHRWDAEQAVGVGTPIATDAAADALELFARLLLLLETDTPIAFEVTPTDAAVTITMFGNGCRPVAGTLSGSSSDLLLMLWHRIPMTGAGALAGAGSIVATGDTDAIGALIAATEFD